MDLLDLLTDAQHAGLTVTTEDGRLVIRGPRSAEAIAKELMATKAEVVALVQSVGPAVNWEAATPRSLELLADPAAFFEGWRYINGAWVAPWAPRP